MSGVVTERGRDEVTETVVVLAALLAPPSWRRVAAPPRHRVTASSHHRVASAVGG
jgi:hypothetical protein